MSRSARARTRRIGRRSAATLEILEGRGLLSTLYADVLNTTGIEDGTQAHPFSHIQAAINASVAGDTVDVAPGVYIESLVIPHALNLIGPNAGVDPNTGTRGPEAVLLPDVNNPDSGRMILVTGNDVTVDGLTIDGHNAALSDGQLLNGISSNAASGVTNVDSSGGFAVIAGLTVQNDIIRNLTAFGVMADINDFSTSTHAISTGNAIRNNLIDNLPVVSPVPGRGISIEDNFYADVTGNVVTRAGTGIQAIFMLDPNPSPTPSVISGNIISDYALGIYLWTIDSDAPAFDVSNNTIAAEDDPQTAPGNAGIELDRVLHSAAVSLSNNDVTGAHAGIEFQYTPVSPTITVTGGTLSGNDYGVLITNSDVVPGDVPPKPVQGSLSGVTISHSKLAAINVVDALAAAGATVTLNVDAATVLTGNAQGAVLSGPNAHLVESVPPVITFTGTPPPQTTDTTATFTFTTTDNITTPGDLTVEYQLDGGVAVPATSPVPLSGLTVGPHTFVVMATDQAGNTASVSYQWTVTLPPPPSTPELDPSSDTGSSATDGITRDSTPTFTGTAPAGNMVTLFDGNTVLGTTLADGNGNWAFTVGGPGSVVASLADGSHAISATDTDGNGSSSSPSGATPVVVDNAVPSVSLTATPPLQTLSASASFAFTTADDVSGSDNLVVQYSLDGTAPATAVSPVNFSGLAIGSHTFIVMATDQAGNVNSLSYSWTVTPPPPSTPELDPSSDTGSSATDGITRDSTPTFTGTALAGNTVTLFDGNTVLGTTLADGNGNWAFTVGGPGSVVASLADGSHAIKAIATVGTAASGTSGSLALVVDTAAPTLTLTGAPPAQTFLNLATFSFTTSDGPSGSAGLVTRYALDGGTPNQTTSPLNVILEPIAYGQHTLVLTTTDVAGNVSTVQYPWNYMAAPPAPPSTPALSAASDTGSSSTDGITNDSTPTWTGTAPAGSTVTLFAGMTTLGTTTAGPDGQWTFTVGGLGSIVARLADGAYGITATSTTSGGNSQPSPSRLIVVDTSPPILRAAVARPANAAGWYNTNVLAVYKAVDFRSGLASPSLGLFTFSAQGKGQSHVFTVQDVAGNTASASVGSVNIDKTPPSVTIGANPSSLRAGGTRPVVVRIAGTILDRLSGDVPTATYTLRDSYRLISGGGAVKVGRNGTYSFTVPLQAILRGKSARAYTITVTTHDLAGNARSVSTTLAVLPVRGSRA